MSETIRSNRFDAWFAETGPAALVVREELIPVDGRDGVFYPATYAAAEDKSKFAGGYNIDTFPDGSNVCLIDSVGSQANRIEPIFSRPPYSKLIPQIEIVAGEKVVNLLEAGHRAGDAIVRCSELKTELNAAFKQVLQGNVEALAKIAPTSLVFGVWDSRDTQAKLPRLVAVSIKAFNIRKLTRSAQYVPAINYVDEGMLPEPADKKTADAYAERGFIHVPASGSHGGVQLTEKGSVRRDAVLNLAPLRRLAARDAAGTLRLHRYLLGLSLVALTAVQDTYLRQGCNLVPTSAQSRSFELVHASGEREPFSLSHADAIVFATAAADEFAIGPSRKVPFDTRRASGDIQGEVKKAKGEVASIDLLQKSFLLKSGKGKDQQEIEIRTSGQTEYLRAKEPSTFEGVVTEGAKLEVELSGDIASKVISKK